MADLRRPIGCFALRLFALCLAIGWLMVGTTLVNLGLEEVFNPALGIWCPGPMKCEKALRNKWWKNEE